MHIVRRSGSTLAVFAAVLATGCGVFSGEESTGARTLVAEDARPRCASGAGRRSISTDPKSCKLTLFVCAPGETPFFDACGCGCERR
ncbi:hypothetical protein LZ198_38775 [Myxococcus sp. K15C18031901]|uniref:hypothetical protein n=1 Tax=Myxococcus dinghuensis TaxID=2906761 RepID=UPI0020A79350|nr:hypothetical protein [Myxococcus dinghuensis]MCP3104827.1 hypothetical protein [Myxococcus dinghuensis]